MEYQVPYINKNTDTFALISKTISEAQAKEFQTLKHLTNTFKILNKDHVYLNLKPMIDYIYKQDMFQFIIKSGDHMLS